MSSNIIKYLDEVHICPHCEQKLSCCHAPAIHVGDGLGWGAEVLFICLNDSCSLFLNGWDKIEQQYGHHASYRYMELPESSESNVMMVGNADAYKASVVDPKELKKQNERHQKQKKAVEQLETCVSEKNLEPALYLILDEAADVIQRKKAVSLLPQINDLACIDPIRNHTFRDTSLEMAANQALEELLKNNLQKECPFCSNLIKMQAKKCMHCKEDLE
jgi:hypothetical protein